jgi:hypothetical protein
MESLFKDEAVPEKRLLAARAAEASARAGSTRRRVVLASMAVAPAGFRCAPGIGHRLPTFAFRPAPSPRKAPCSSTSPTAACCGWNCAFPNRKRRA